MRVGNSLKLLFAVILSDIFRALAKRKMIAILKNGWLLFFSSNPTYLCIWMDDKVGYAFWKKKVKVENKFISTKCRIVLSLRC